jgi:tRNA pseudouridine55 synthase
MRPKRVAELLEGILLVDKPSGPTSHDVVATVRRLSGIRRVGHTGTLDPLATGLLAICIGRATRLAEYLSGQRKSYQATVRLGQDTTTYDAEGEIVAERQVTVSEEEIAAALEMFRGEISQLPPLYSAVKVDGRPMYRHAREGVEVERPARAVTIYEIELVRWRTPLLEVRIVCSSGMYVRSLAYDLGRVLDCGGHVKVLRRTAIGSFAVDEAVSLEALDKEQLLKQMLPAEAAVRHLPRLALSGDDALELYYGRAIARSADQPEASLASAFDDAGQFVGLVKSAGEYWQPHKIFYRQ